MRNGKDTPKNPSQCESAPEMARSTQDDEQARLREWVRATERREGTLTRAAKALGVAQPTLSRLLARQGRFGQKVERGLSEYWRQPIEALRTTSPGGASAEPLHVAVAGNDTSFMTDGLIRTIREVHALLCDDLGCESDIASAAIGRVIMASEEAPAGAFALYRAALRLIIARGKGLLSDG